jgi:hypothetical protein
VFAEDQMAQHGLSSQRRFWSALFTAHRPAARSCRDAERLGAERELDVSESNGCGRSAGTLIHELFMAAHHHWQSRVSNSGGIRLPSCYPLLGGTLMASKISVAAAIALSAIVAVPSASLAASKAKNSYRDVTKCEGGACTAVNPDRDYINTSRNAQFYRGTHKKHKTPPKN